MLSALFEHIPVMIMAVGSLVGIAASLLGTFLVLRKSSMLTDAISHSILLGIMVVWLLTRQTSGPLQIIGAGLSGVATVYLSEMLAKSQRVKYDAAIGLVFPALFAAGVLLTNLYARNVHIDADTVLLGEIGFVWLDTVEIRGYYIPESLLSMGFLTVINLLFVSLLFKELKLSTFDPALARALGFNPNLLFYPLLGLTSATAVAAFDAVGAILFIAFVIVPPSAAYLLTDRLWRVLLFSCIFAVASSISGYYLAVWLDVSIGGMMAVMTGVYFTFAFLFGPRYGLIAQEIRRKNQRLTNRSRALVVHLYNHERTSLQSEENVVQALKEHLVWNETKAKRTLLRSLDDHLVEREGETLYLTAKGRAVAQEILEPWRQNAALMPGADEIQ